MVCIGWRRKDCSFGLDKTLNIAHCVQDYQPGVGGMAEVAKQLSERLVAKGHKVTVFTSFQPDRKSDVINGVHIRSFEISGNSVIGINGNPAGYIHEITSGDFDIVTLFAAQQWSADLLLPLLDHISARKVFVPTGFSALGFPQYEAYYEQMKDYLKKFDMNVFLSDKYQDIEFARQHGVTRMTVIPNGAAEEEFSSKPTIDFRGKFGLDDHQVILHVGSYTGSKGHIQAVKIFIESKTKNTILVLAGSGVKNFKKSLTASPRNWMLWLRWQLSGKKILFLELNRSETIAAFQNSDVFLFPSQVECSPIVLFECMAAGLPFISSAAGNAEELTEWSNHGGWIIPTESKKNNRIEVSVTKGAQLLDNVLTDKNKLQSASNNAKQAWKDKFTWNKIVNQYEALYLNLANKS